MKTKQIIKEHKQKYWYKTFVHFCPVCGHEDWYKERQYSEKPKERNKRIEWEEHYDWCDAL